MIFRKDLAMRQSTHDKIEGDLHKLKGKIKEKAGQILGDRELEGEGTTEHTKGKWRKKIGEIKKVFNH
jgi:uncharacterized protein YjbJ (UPF0337 family)